MAIYDDLQEASVVLGAAGLAGTGVTAGQLSDILNRITALEAKVNPPSQAVLGTRWYGPLTTLAGWPRLTTLTMTANRLYAVPFYVPQPATFNTPGLTVTTAVAGATVHLGIYGLTSNGVAGALVQDLGTVNAGTVGFRSNANTITLARGLYWFAGAASAAGVAVETTVGQEGVTSVLGSADTTGNLIRSSFYRTTDLAAGFTTLPDPFGSFTTTFVIPVFWLRAA